MTGNDSSRHAQLLAAAYRQTLARFEEDVAGGRRDPVAELDMYRKRRRDYASLLRMGTVPDEARALAQQLLETHRINSGPGERDAFERETAALLVRLYDAFIDSALNASRNKGSGQ